MRNQRIRILVSLVGLVWFAFLGYKVYTSDEFFGFNKIVGIITVLFFGLLAIYGIKKALES